MFKSKEECMKAPYDTAVEDLKDALIWLHLAENKFNYIDPDFFEMANAELTAARACYDACLKRVQALKK